MYQLRPANERGRSRTGWLDSFHTFSFSSYYHPEFMGFSDLRVINDDIVAPGQGFGMHPHADMEIVSIVLSGTLEHKDSLGNGSIIYPGDIQKMTAGSGILHSEFNPSPTEAVHFLQIWLLPNRKGLKPYYEQKSFTPQQLSNRFCPVASPEGKDGTVKIHQDTEIYRCRIDAEKNVGYKLSDRRSYWLQMASGAAELNGAVLAAGDGVAVAGENGSLNLRGIDTVSDIILFNLRP